MTDIPESPADPRPNDEPYYIDSECPECSTELIEYHEVPDEVREEETALAPSQDDTEESGPWHDEWICPECLDGIHMDWPPTERKNLELRLEEIENFQKAMKLDKDGVYQDDD